MSAQVQKACFKIDAEFVVHTARRIFLEGNPHCIRVLVDGFEGMDYDTAYAILRGEKTLTGWSHLNNVQLIDDKPTEYQKDVNRMYGAALKFKNKFYRPAAYVFALGKEDADHAMREGEVMYVGSGKYSSRFGHVRAMYYKRGGEIMLDLNVVTEHGPEIRPVFFEPLEWFPDFLPYKVAPEGAQGCLDAFVASGRRLAARGPESVRLGVCEERDNPLTGKPVKKRKPKAHGNPGPKIEPVSKLHKYVKLDYDPDDGYVSWFESINGMLCDLDGTPLDKQVSDFKVLETVEAEDCDKLDWRGTYLHRGEDDAEAGWITPEGIFYGCDYGQHRMLVEMMFKRGMEQHLLDDGYVKIWYGPKAKIGALDVRWICFKKLTDAQRETLIRMGHDTSDNDRVYRE